jgi:hypothetical protein
MYAALQKHFLQRKNVKFISKSAKIHSSLTEALYMLYDLCDRIQQIVFVCQYCNVIHRGKSSRKMCKKSAWFLDEIM